MGNTLTLPSQFRADEKGHTWTLTSPDGNTKINVITFTVEGSGSREDFKKLLEKSIDNDGPWKDSAWAPVRLANVDAVTREFDPTDKEGPSAWLIYVIQSGDYYHAILVQASPLVMELNGGFYRDQIRSFKCKTDAGGG